jgi:ribosomal protein S18 acetylase RimI-like enzyme
MSDDQLDIRPLTETTWPDLAGLFRSGGDPRWCWCQYFRVRGLDWTNSSAAENESRLRAMAVSGPPPGLVAYRDDEAVGWVSLGPRASFERLAHSVVLAPVDDRPVWSIVCFVVARRARRSGVARALLDGAIAYARSHGAIALEAYPVDNAGGRVPAASAYQGTLSMFERAGFGVVARRQFNRSSPTRPIVRLEL